MFCFSVWYFPVIKKLSALVLVCRIIKVSFRLWETHQLWEHNIRAVLKISVQWSASRVKRLESSVQSPASRVESQVSRVQSPAPESSVQSPAYNSCVQSPGILVCRDPEALVTGISKNDFCNLLNLATKESFLTFNKNCYI